MVRKFDVGDEVCIIGANPLYKISEVCGDGQVEYYVKIRRISTDPFSFNGDRIVNIEYISIKNEFLTRKVIFEKWKK